jgi:hypothetical protein
MLKNYSRKKFCNIGPRGQYFQTLYGGTYVTSSHTHPSLTIVSKAGGITLEDQAALPANIRPGATVVSFYGRKLWIFCNKLKCLSLASLSSLV